MGREEAQRIIHTFAVMKLSESNSSEDEILNRDASEDEEEQRYLHIFQTNAPIHRPPSVGSIQTMVTAPGTPRQFPAPRPPSSISTTRRGLQIGSRDLLPNAFDEEEEERMSTNPWAVQQSRERNMRTPMGSLRLPSPSHGFYSVGPATKQAIEALQNEIVTLGKRIDDLRTEIIERDRKKSTQSKKVQPIKRDDDYGWKWVIKAALKYAGVNFMAAFILLIILYKMKSPIAYEILEQISKHLHPLRLPIKAY